MFRSINGIVANRPGCGVGRIDSRPNLTAFSGPDDALRESGTDWSHLTVGVHESLPWASTQSGAGGWPGPWMIAPADFVAAYDDFQSRSNGSFSSLPAFDGWLTDWTFA